MPRLALALGVDIFENFINKSDVYIDKSLFIRDIIDNANQVILLTRPRRFGKTLNMTMLKAFFEVKNEEKKKKYAEYFKNLNIKKCGNEYLSHFGKYPVIFMTLKDIESRTWDNCFKGLKKKVAEVFEYHSEVMAGLKDHEKDYYNVILKQQGDFTQTYNAIGDLSRWLNEYYGEQVILLIDEYDAPINDGFNNGYSEEVIEFFKNMFSYAMKTNPALHKAVLTGLTKIAGKSLFSKLNHFISYNVMKKEFSQYFGFTQDEVQATLKKCNVKHSIDEVARWYNGYNFGGTSPIYNPWSIMNICADPEEILLPYWINTSSDSALGAVINNMSISIKERLYELVNGAILELPLVDDVTYENLKLRPDIIWTFLMYAGYLTAIDYTMDTATFKIPNFEVKQAMQETMSRWLVDPSQGTEDVKAMLLGMLTGNQKLVQKKLSTFVFNAFSYFDMTKQEPERVYHAFLLGLLSHVQSNYYFNSNPIAGEGRADILIMPKAGDYNKNAVIMEFKQTDEKLELENAAKKALEQIKEKQYIAEAKKRGAEVVYAYGIGFCGRDIHLVMEKV